MRRRYTLSLRDGKTLRLGERTLIVGILNVTPDSFSDGGQYMNAQAAVEHALRMQSEGADIIEVGGESTRPDAARVSQEAELARLTPVLEALRGRLSLPISVDTYKSKVARRAIELGGDLINDVSALRFDPALASVVAESQAALVLMHMRGEPATMQTLAPSPDIFAEIESDLRTALAEAEKRGVERQRIILDPGIGFGKTLEQNLEILNHLERIAAFDLPLMVGTSRKSFIGRITGRAADDRVFGTAASVAAAILRGAHFIRVHDVKEMIEVARVADAILRHRL